jgi:hypothetical protein
MKTLNFRTFVTFLCIAVIGFTSCSKNKDAAPPPSPMEGTWVGKWGHNNAVPNTYISFVIKSNGTLVVKEDNANNPNLGTGNWSLNESTFKVIYSYNDNPEVKFIVVAKLNDSKTEISGSWGDGEEDPDNGTIIMEKTAIQQ